MHFECDYTQSDAFVADMPDTFGSPDKLNHLLEMIQGSHKTKCFSERKKNQVIASYLRLEELASVQGGKASLDIDEASMKARILFWSETITLVPNDYEFSRSVLIELIQTYDVIYFVEKNRGIEICIDELLFDEI